MKKNKIYTFELASREDTITGMIIDYSQEWIFIKYIPDNFFRTSKISGMTL